jgi:serine/threonine-protein kinase
MTPERYRQIGELYHRALEIEPRLRTAFLEAACGGDERLRNEVESLLASDEQAESFLTSPAIEVAARDLAEKELRERIGRRLRQYRILSLLGAGGMGEVYLAEDTSLGRTVAIKFLHPASTEDDVAKRRFLREARAAARLDHHNICSIHEVGEDGGDSFIVMQYVEGETLKSVVDGRPLGLDSLVSIGLQIADALAAAHEQGVVHRDLKSNNIIVTERGQAKVLDFGLAKLLPDGGASSEIEVTKTGAVIGTPSYMSPEQARGEAADRRSDIFSLGVVMYEMATGDVPFRRKSAAETMNAVINEPHAPAAELNDDVPPELSAIIDRALAKAPADRYQSAGEMIGDLRSLLAGGAADRISIPYVPLQRRALLGRLGRWARRPSARAPVAATALVAVVGLAAAYFVFTRRPQPPTRAEASAPVRSLAVLPFKPLTAESRDEPLEMGMADTLITRLSALRQLVVRPMSAVRRYTGLEQDPVVAAQEQGVDAVLDGCVQKSGERVRVTVRLLSATDGRQLWADKFEQSYTDIFSVQDSIAERVAAALAVELTGEEKARLLKRYTDNPEAYQLYLNGRYYAAKWTPEGVRRAKEDFNRAIAVDPTYALAYDGLAYCYYAADWDQSSYKEGLAKGRALAERALQIDPTLAEAHTSLGIMDTWTYDWPAAEREFKRAFELNPNYAPAHLWYGWYLHALGRSGEGIAEIERALEIDPLSAEANTALGMVFFYTGRYDDALRQLDRTVGLEPGFWFAHLYIARVYEKKGEIDAAVAKLEETKLMEGASPEVSSALGHLYAAAGRTDEARRVVAELKELSKRRYVSSYNVATVYAGLGEKDRAFEYLEKEYRDGTYYLNLLKSDPELDALRSVPRFDELLGRVGLAR